MEQRTPAAEVAQHTGSSVRLAGWVNARRDMGKIVFLDLRDASGVVQIVVPPSSPAAASAKDVRNEWVIGVTGTVQPRAKGKENPKLATGSVEVKVESLTVLNASDGTPFDVTTDGREVSEEVRMRHRYLDLRRPRVQRVLRERHRIEQYLRTHLSGEGFTEVETPVLTKGTPEGAREYIVPSRLEPGSFYVLPQSPQQFKQLLMVGGIERYFQIARCFRDEDSRGDRQPEFTQLDLEMAFVDTEDVLATIERAFTAMVTALFPEKSFPKPFPRYTYAEVMERYGSDKPDLRTDPKDPNELAFAIVTDFPLFERSEEENKLVATHHLFTAPQDAYVDGDRVREPYTEAKGKQYDVICNGFEVAGGSIRIHRPALQRDVFRILGIPDAEAERRFGHMLEAFRYGAPPHGGIAVGLDRLIAVLLDEPNIREVIAFPKNSAGRDLLFGAPSPLPPSALADVHIASVTHGRRKSGPA